MCLQCVKTHVTGSAILWLQDTSAVNCRGKREPATVNYRGKLRQLTSKEIETGDSLLPRDITVFYMCVSAFFYVYTTIFHKQFQKGQKFKQNEIMLINKQVGPL
jgi:hypothetical protein